ncbi:pentapeptide repeat-containing protein [Nocardia stercoris]|uniref:Pentapeptide repeat-containing protein n=1 Tax=Nocardia stercoris TaxID=2483361 RepID=A0A3M2KWR5_9NOCA|nr:pentapeptide repeat-containing protein [Nocardia stercoris]
MAGRLHRSALLVNVVGVVLGGLVVVAATWGLLRLLLGVHSEPPNQLDLTKIALSVTAGIGGAVALVVAYRRQRDNERGRFAELFGAAAKQLGDPDVAVRIAGVYAMAGVADEFSAPARRQQCVDVLCGYLRLPFDPADGGNHLTTRKSRRTADGTEHEETFGIRQNDSRVRRTIVAVIVRHLRPGAENSWSDCNFNFEDAVLEDADFRFAVFAGRHTHFRGARFVGTRLTNFSQVRFVGRHISFHSARFEQPVWFQATRFVSDPSSNSDLDGRSGVSFKRAVFTAETNFEGAEFGGPRVRFTDATFAGAETAFTGARFHADLVSFQDATFTGAGVRFSETSFEGRRISFAGTGFRALRTAFDDARLGGRGRLRRPSTNEIDFRGAQFRNSVSFADTVVDGKSADFSGADFAGDISFRRTRFDARAVSFDAPVAWDGVFTDWDAEPERRQPGHITPEVWPPVTGGGAPQ